MMGNKTEITTLAVGLALGKVALYLLTPFLVPTWGEIDEATGWATMLGVAFAFAFLVPGDVLARTLAKLTARPPEPPASPPAPPSDGEAR